MSEHCHCHCHDEESHTPRNRYEEAFGKYNCHLHDEEVHAAVTRLLESKKAQYNTQMKMMAYMMPLFIGFISWSFASGLRNNWLP